MENFPLNKAHRLYRKAESCLRSKNFDEAVVCHEQAIKFLEDALQMTRNAGAIDSIHAQCDYHRRQIGLTIFRKKVEELKKASAGRKFRMAKHDFFKDTDTLQDAIQKKMDEADSIVELLCQRIVKPETENAETDPIDKQVVQCHNISDTLLISGVKEPKNDDIVIEELQVVNTQLRKFVNELLNQLEESTQEVKTLKSKVRFLEKERNRLLGLPTEPLPSPKQPDDPEPDSESSETQPESSLPIVSESSVDNSSTFVFPNIVVDDRELPPLAPLEMPDFDFETLMSQIKVRSDASQEKPAE